jgi:hypothetical protein
MSMRAMNLELWEHGVDSEMNTRMNCTRPVPRRHAIIATSLPIRPFHPAGEDDS